MRGCVFCVICCKEFIFDFSFILLIFAFGKVRQSLYISSIEVMAREMLKAKDKFNKKKKRI